jgi:ribosomal protein S18 acetylase RimI-like enzyme
MQKMKIRKVKRFSEHIYAAVVRLLPQLDPSSEVPSKEYFSEILKSKDTYFFIVELSDGEIAGMLTLVMYRIPTGNKVWIEDVVIDLSQRGKGLGEQLMVEVLDYSKSLGVKEIRLTSRPSRIAANKLYQRLGFIQYETNVYKYTL